MATKAGVALLIGGALGFVWWLSRPVQGGTRINPVAGLRG